MEFLEILNFVTKWVLWYLLSYCGAYFVTTFIVCWKQKKLLEGYYRILYEDKLNEYLHDYLDEHIWDVVPEDDYFKRLMIVLFWPAMFGAILAIYDNGMKEFKREFIDHEYGG